MSAVSEQGGAVSAGYTRSHLEHLENMLQELTRAEDRERRQKMRNASINTKQKLLNDQLLRTQDELAAAQRSKDTLCEEIGTLKQTNEHQAQQLKQYKLDWKAARESQEAAVNKMENMEASTRIIKEQCLRSLAARIRTSEQVLQQLNVTIGTSFSARNAENCSDKRQMTPIKRKRVPELKEKSTMTEDSDKPQSTGIAMETEHQVERLSEPVAADAVSPMRRAKESEQQDRERAESKRIIAELQAQVDELEAEHSALSDKYTTLMCDHNETLTDSKAAAQDIEAKNSKIEELIQMLEVSRSKEHSIPTEKNSETDVDKEALGGRLKMLEENLAQMNGYADQLEMVIGQCPSCTAKLQSEGTQDPK
ncbi:hypothetical protein PHMEG_00020021 [Phytophthora megakarya]|uniref:Uncharacterized protein n=1 Tax=Phytophthora megakarya TaxID=4795 RepID=A0A225VS00_9STRA|nr:hypothetical protein PHMEG_00020021 [Phytophthora megakarya]